MLLAEAAQHRPIGQRAIEFAGTIMIVMLLLLVLWQYMVRYQHQHLRVRRHFLLQVACFVITLGLARSVLHDRLGDEPVVDAHAVQFADRLSVSGAACGRSGFGDDPDRRARGICVFGDSVGFCRSVFGQRLSGGVHVDVERGRDLSLAELPRPNGARSGGALDRRGECRDDAGAGSARRKQPDLRLLLFDSFCGYAGGVLATMAASIMLPLFEWMFEITTSIKLLELVESESAAAQATGRARAGNLSPFDNGGPACRSRQPKPSAATRCLRASPVTTTTSARACGRRYFVENQSYMDNRHDKLSPKMSSIVLANHVKQGIEIAKQHKLPPRIIAIIPQHHGTGLMKFFYYKARKGTEDTSTALEQEFRYPGPKPKTKEAAIIMIADSVEAAARTVEEPTPAKLRNMIDMIIDSFARRRAVR